jgi:MFS family permease
MLFVGQLIVGVGVGIDFPVSSSYISEISPKRDRDRMMVATIACQSIGMLLAAAITLVLLNCGGAQSWRLFLWSEGLVALLFFVSRFSAPESPHWLMSQADLQKRRKLSSDRPRAANAVLQLPATMKSWELRFRR